MELRRERQEWIEVRRSFYEFECDVCWVVCQMWGEVVRVWCSSFIRIFSP